PRLYGPASWALEVQHSIREGASAAAAGAGGASRLVVGSGTLQGAFSGYSQDDSVLGAPLALARTPVFTALSPAPLYWRGESKSVYEGRGWREDYGQLQSVPVGSGQGTESGGSAGITQTVRLARHAEGQPLPVSGRNAELMAAQGEGAGKGASSYLKDKMTEAIYLPQGGSGELQYEMRSVKPETSASVLRAQSETKETAEGADAEWLQEQIQANLQLPANLPKRVKDLASSIVRAAGPNRYDQAAAVSGYLKEHYVYSLTDTSIPEEAYLCEAADGERLAALEQYLAEPPAEWVQIGSPFISFFYYEALSKLGRHELMLDDIRLHYGRMLEHGATTCWEMYPDFAENRANPDLLTRSHCHAWSAAPGYFLGASILGVRKLSAGWRSVEIAPQPAGLSWAEGVVPLPDGGEISVSWRVAGKYISLRIEAPSDIAIQVTWPEGHAGTVEQLTTARM
ncbi:alpha-L-rhamnosidase C-terminal domain-containing protein, partial [Paenibacillus sp. P22]|uniref:alpha-L-rhamnosidase C-terminal domain-containing protein n=1 Tax=Paenibacillus sp. P22 TaxID=483908 RepID=UPI0004340E0D